VHVRFCGTEREVQYTLETLLRGKDFHWNPLPVGLHCLVKNRGECIIMQSPFGPNESSQVHEYMVEFPSEGNSTATLNERELWPIPGSLTETPQTKLAAFQLDHWVNFRTRDGLLNALTRLHQETAGIRALASSRIELLAHQASVIGTVIDDSRWRYILADEVGLGKTVEAGVIIQELLAEKPQARILILCPGPLSRQWLCEMHLSFGGGEFKLADLHQIQEVNWSAWNRTICSLKLATQVHQTRILEQQWDLIVVDEGHRLLWNQAHYNLVKELSFQTEGILILSAVPARERSTELLKLLQLIDPKAYADNSSLATHFEEVYREQPLIGRRLRILQSRLINSEGKISDVQNAARRLLEVPLLSTDVDLQSTLKRVVEEDDRSIVENQCHGLMREVASRYRISRRILKNRRAQLKDQDLIKGVDRRLEIVLYEPGPLESSSHDLLVQLFGQLKDSAAPGDALQVLFRKAVTSLCDPVALMEVSVALRDALEQRESLELNLDLDLDPSTVLDYDEHEHLLNRACSVLAPYIDAGLVERLITYAQAWISTTEVPIRITRMFDALDEILKQDTAKVVVFAGTIGAAELVVEQLQIKYGKAFISEFRHDLDDNIKEDEVTKFRRNPECKILVCDESGGEGRNFQFATALFHYDLPWLVSAIEQRIGRLDRIGREDPVNSIVITARSSMEADWLKCLTDGFEVFERSISGLEFVLRETEHQVVERVMLNGPDQIDALIDEVKATCLKERASDEADALTDIASFNRILRRSTDASQTADARIEEFFPRYMRTIGVGQVANRVTDKKDLNLRIWRLRPEDVTQVQLPGIHRNQNGQLGDHFGTFLRSVARDRPDLEFFASGNGLFEAVCSVAQSHITGRTFAVQVHNDSLAPGIYILSTWQVCPGTTNVEEKHIGRALRHLYGRRIRIMVETTSGEFVDSVLVRGFETCLFDESSDVVDLRDKGTTLIDGTQSSWASTIDSLTNASKLRVPNENNKSYGGVDQDYSDRITQEILRLKQWGRGDSKELISALEDCLKSVQKSNFVLDSLGVVRVMERSDDAATVS
jgi:ATP-dependent helicase HepA